VPGERQRYLLVGLGVDRGLGQVMPDLVEVDEPVELVDADGLAGYDLIPEVAEDDVHPVRRIQHDSPGVLPGSPLVQLRQRDALIGLAKSVARHAVHGADRRPRQYVVLAAFAGPR
jgi:hypothetical protein